MASLGAGAFAQPAETPRKINSIVGNGHLAAVFAATSAYGFLSFRAPSICISRKKSRASDVVRDFVGTCRLFD